MNLRRGTGHRTLDHGPGGLGEMGDLNGVCYREQFIFTVQEAELATVAGGELPDRQFRFSFASHASGFRRGTAIELVLMHFQSKKSKSKNPNKSQRSNLSHPIGISECHQLVGFIVNSIAGCENVV